ncbi:MAG TPA: DUF1800 domain-containing protein [Candidatus Eisenbacteria bacterium]|jgi:uncharacterized protein (DUF1800 family)
MMRAPTFATLPSFSTFARTAALLATLLVTLFAVTVALAAAPARARERPHPLSARDSALHVLNRFAYGPRPGEVDEVARQGALAWLEAQLAPEALPDSALALRAKHYDAFALQPGDWARLFAAGQRAMRERRAQAEEREAMRGDEPAPLDTTRAGGVRPGPAPEREEVGRLLEQVRGVALVRAVTAEAQLREVMTDFWVNHFNVFLNKGADRCLLPAYVEDVIRPHALGRFEDLLVATARSPAMLFYLDNVESVAPGRALGPNRRGINENYARELLELHTLGVDGGYTQADVIDVARILTGWSMEPPAQGGGFVFRPRAHDAGEKLVLGERFPAGHGLDEGLRLLAMLARHPATARHVCRKLCARFVADDPPDGCVDAAVAAWERSDGDVREVLRAIARTPEFWSARALRTKVKTPLEFVASAARAVGAVPDTTARLADAVGRLGEPLYLQPSPAGYPERQEAWANSGALLGRMNFALALAAGRVPGTTVDLDDGVPADGDREQLVEAIDERILGGAMSASTRHVILEEIAGEADARRARALAVGLALGSPEFQRQ